MPIALATDDSSEDGIYRDSEGNLYKAWYNDSIRRWQVLIYWIGEAPDGTPTTHIINRIGYLHEAAAADAAARKLAYRIRHTP